MTKRECRIYFRKLKQNIKPHLTNNYRKMHGGTMLRSGTMYEYGKKHQYCRRVRSNLRKREE